MEQTKLDEGKVMYEWDIPRNSTLFDVLVSILAVPWSGDYDPIELLEDVKRHFEKKRDRGSGSQTLNVKEFHG